MSQDGIDKGRRQFLVNSASVVGGCGLAAATIPFISSWLPSSRAQDAGAPVECDITQLTDGQQIIMPWRGKPVFVVRRPKTVLDKLNQLSDDVLRDPKSKVEAQQPQYAQNIHRSLVPEILVLIAICTHLGCSPKYRPEIGGELGDNWPGGFYCPCHGSKFDMAGRVFHGVPAPVNLEVPPYHYRADGKVLVIGENPSGTL